MTETTATGEAGAEESFAEYGRADHARKYRSTSGTQAPIDELLRQRCLADLDRQGYRAGGGRRRLTTTST